MCEWMNQGKNKRVQDYCILYGLCGLHVPQRVSNLHGNYNLYGTFNLHGNYNLHGAMTTP